MAPIASATRTWDASSKTTRSKSPESPPKNLATESGLTRTHWVSFGHVLAVARHEFADRHELSHLRRAHLREELAGAAGRGGLVERPSADHLLGDDARECSRSPGGFDVPSDLVLVAGGSNWSSPWRVHARVASPSRARVRTPRARPLIPARPSGGPRTRRAARQRGVVRGPDSQSSHASESSRRERLPNGRRESRSNGPRQFFAEPGSHAALDASASRATRTQRPVRGARAAANRNGSRRRTASRESSVCRVPRSYRGSHRPASSTTALRSRATRGRPGRAAPTRADDETGDDSDAAGESRADCFISAARAVSATRRSGSTATPGTVCGASSSATL